MVDDNVNHPAHYTQFSHEVIELAATLDFCLGNCVKYILRAPFKGYELEDLKKARWYLSYVLENYSRNPALARPPFKRSQRRLFSAFEKDLRTAGRDDLAEIFNRFSRGWMLQADHFLNLVIDAEEKSNAEIQHKH